MISSNSNKNSNTDNYDDNTDDYENNNHDYNENVNENASFVIVCHAHELCPSVVRSLPLADIYRINVLLFVYQMVDQLMYDSSDVLRIISIV